MSKRLKEWTDEDLEWGLVGCGHDLDNALEMIKDAKDLEEAKKASKEYLSVWRCSTRYEKEIQRRKDNGTWVDSLERHYANSFASPEEEEAFYKNVSQLLENLKKESEAK